MALKIMASWSAQLGDDLDVHLQRRRPKGQLAGGPGLGPDQAAPAPGPVPVPCGRLGVPPGGEVPVNRLSGREAARQESPGIAPGPVSGPARTPGTRGLCLPGLGLAAARNGRIPASVVVSRLQAPGAEPEGRVPLGERDQRADQPHCVLDRARGLAQAECTNHADKILPVGSAISA
jgi:hypothetical protein